MSLGGRSVPDHCPKATKSISGRVAGVEGSGCYGDPERRGRPRATTLRRIPEDFRAFSSVIVTQRYGPPGAPGAPWPFPVPGGTREPHGPREGWEVVEEDGWERSTRVYMG